MGLVWTRSAQTHLAQFRVHGAHRKLCMDSGFLVLRHLEKLYCRGLSIRINPRRNKAENFIQVVIAHG